MKGQGAKWTERVESHALAQSHSTLITSSQEVGTLSLDEMAGHQLGAAQKDVFLLLFRLSLPHARTYHASLSLSLSFLLILSSVVCRFPA